MLDAINAQRIDHGRAPVRADPALAQRATLHARKMARRGTAFHTANLRWACRPYLWGGEVVGVGKSQGSLVRAWMRSDEHRPILLGRHYTHAGAGWVHRSGHLWAVVLFGG